MSDDDAEAFLREVRAALATARPEEPSLDSLQRLMTWLQTTESLAVDAVILEFA